MGLIVAQWGGDIMSDPSAGVPIEIWSNMIAVSTLGPVDSSELNSVQTEVSLYWGAESSTMAPQVALNFIKVNEFNPTTGIQVTDPTHEYIYGTPPRGFGVITNPRPITTARRVTIDDGTRNRRHKGGWFSPVVVSTIEDDFRWSSTSTDSACIRARDFIRGINAVSGCTAVVWSRVAGTLTPVTRVRVGDVPDNISRRKNNMREAYATHSV